MVPARVVLYLLSFSGFLVSFMMRMDINLTMVAMAKAPPNADQSTTATHCYVSTNLSYPSNDNITNEKPKVSLSPEFITYIYLHYLTHCLFFLRTLSLSLNFSVIILYQFAQLTEHDRTLFIFDKVRSV